MTDENIVGQKFGRLTIIELPVGQAVPPSKRKVVARCDCGTQRPVRLYHLKVGHTKSCGCLAAERMIARGKARTAHSKLQARLQRSSGYKQCRGRCRAVKPTSEFYFNATSHDGFGYYCRQCDREKEWLRRYGITFEQYEALASNGCMICRRQSPGNGNTYFSVDHNHTTGEVFGVLCNPCNTGIGFLRENVEIIASALVYVRKKHGMP